MAFKKKTWVDRMVEYAGRRKITNVTTMAAQIVDVERAEGVVSEEGTAINAVNMNDLEQRTADAFSAVQQDIEGINSDLGGNRFGFTSDGQPGYKKAGADTVYPFKSNISFGPYQTFQGEGNNGKDGYGCIVASRSFTAGYYMFYVTGYYIREGNGIIDNVVLCNGSTNILSSGRLHSQNGVCSNVILYQLTSNATLTIKLYLSTARGVGQGICNFQQIII